MRVRWLVLHLAAFAILATLTTVIWVATTSAYFWPAWPMLAVGIPLAIHAWLDVVTLWPEVAERQRLTRALALQEGYTVIAACGFTAIWLLAGHGYFWPVWPILVLLLAFGAHLATVVVPRVRGSALAERISTLESSRAGVVDQQESELRRIERDLHDGAQARIVALGMSLGMAEQKLASDPDAARELLAEARVGAREALEELRDLARGIHPPVLSDRGLEAAIAALASRTPLVVSLAVDLPGRPPQAVESAAYFVVAEALANIGKHAHAEHVKIGVHGRNGRVVVQVVDDGVGGARLGGPGLGGLVRRIEGLDGTLELTSPLGGPTSLKAVIPSAS